MIDQNEAKEASKKEVEDGIISLEGSLRVQEWKMKLNVTGPWDILLFNFNFFLENLNLCISNSQKSLVAFLGSFLLFVLCTNLLLSSLSRSSSYIQLNFCNCLCGFCNLHMNTKYNKDIVIADALLEKITTIAEEYSRNHK